MAVFRELGPVMVNLQDAISSYFPPCWPVTQSLDPLPHSVGPMASHSTQERCKGYPSRDWGTGNDVIEAKGRMGVQDFLLCTISVWSCIPGAWELQGHEQVVEGLCFLM